MRKNRNLDTSHPANLANPSRETFSEETMKKNNANKQNTGYASQLTMALRDGLIALAGIGVAAGGILNDELTLWWVGA